MCDVFNRFSVIPVRASAILIADTYVAGTIIGRNSTAPNSIDRWVDNQLNLYVDYTHGSLTTAEIKVDFAHDLFFSLPYDGQNANFTAGKTLTGATSGATAIIVSDTDGGTSGTLIIKSLTKGKNSESFIDNEVIADNNSSPGDAVVNLASGLIPSTAITAESCWYQEVGTAYSAGVTTLVANEYRLGTTDGRFRIPIPIKDRYIRISAKGTGTATNSLMAITAILGVV
jgi:hypothetical protein